MSTGDQLVKVLGQVVDQPVTKKALEELSVIRGRALQLQESAMAIAGLPSAESLAKIERRLRSARDTIADLANRLAELEGRLAAGLRDDRAELAALRAELADLKSRFDAQS